MRGSLRSTSFRESAGLIKIALSSPCEKKWSFWGYLRCAVQTKAGGARVLKFICVQTEGHAGCAIRRIRRIVLVDMDSRS